MPLARLFLSTFSLVCLLSLTPMPLNADQHDDPYLWLEEVEGEKALAWARERNEETLAALQAKPEYERLFEKNLAVYDSQERIGCIATQCARYEPRSQCQSSQEHS